MISHSLTNFAVNRNHVSTILSQVEIWSPFARDLCSTAQLLVYTSSESSIQRSDQTRFRRILGTAPAPSGQKFNGNVFTVAPVSRFIFTHSNRFGLLMAPRSKPPIENELAEIVIRLFSPTFVPSNRTPVIIPFVRTPSIMKPRIVSGTQTCRFLSIRACLWFRVFQDLINQFSMFHPCVWPLAHWIAPLVPLDFPSLVLFTLSFALTLGPWLARFAVARRLLSCATVL